jgi:hypothetical protein
MLPLIIDVGFIYQLQKLKVEPVLLHYLSEIKVLQGTTSTIQVQ